MPNFNIDYKPTGVQVVSSWSGEFLNSACGVLLTPDSILSFPPELEEIPTDL